MIHEAYLDTNTDADIFNICGGIQSKRVMDGLYPIVATTVGKNNENDCEISKSINATANHHTVKSLKASVRPDTWLVLSDLSATPRKSFSILLCANCCSSLVSHDARVVGKSGTM